MTAPGLPGDTFAPANTIAAAILAALDCPGRVGAMGARMVESAALPRRDGA